MMKDDDDNECALAAAASSKLEEQWSSTSAGTDIELFLAPDVGLQICDNFFQVRMGSRHFLLQLHGIVSLCRDLRQFLRIYENECYFILTKLIARVRGMRYIIYPVMVSRVQWIFSYSKMPNVPKEDIT